MVWIVGEELRSIGYCIAVFIAFCSAGCRSPHPIPKQYEWEQATAELTIGEHTYGIAPSSTPGRMVVSLDDREERVEFQLPGPVTQVVDVKATSWANSQGIALAIRGRLEGGEKDNYYWATVLLEGGRKLKLNGARAFLTDSAEHFHIVQIASPESDTIHILLTKSRLGKGHDEAGPTGLIYANVGPGSGTAEIGIFYEVRSLEPLD